MSEWRFCGKGDRVTVQFSQEMTMVLLRGIVAVVLASILAQGANAAAKTYKLSGENTKIDFVGAKTDGSHKGQFKKLKGTASVDGDATTLKLDVTIDLNGMETDNAKLTGHLKSPDFFEVKRYPEAKFVSTSLAKGKNGYTLSGKLTLKDKTEEVSFPADVVADDKGIKLNAKFKIDRNKWGISYGAGKINDEVAIEVSLATK
jgi:polyisoprenoid-binding protein YceI